MSETHLVFQTGQHEEIDPKVLPDGLYSSVKNMRIRHDGKLECRYGYQTAMSSLDPITNTTRSFAHGDAQLLAMVPRTSASPAVMYSKLDASSWKLIAPSSTYGSFGTMMSSVQRTQMSGSQLWPTSSDCVYSPDGKLWSIVGNLDGELFLYRYDPVIGEMLQSWHLGSGTEAGKLILAGSYVVCFFATPLASGALNYFTIHHTNLTVLSGVFMTSAILSRAAQADICPSTGNTFFVVYTAPSGTDFAVGTMNAGTAAYTFMTAVPTPHPSAVREWSLSLAYNISNAHLGIFSKKENFGAEADNSHVFLTDLNTSTLASTTTTLDSTGYAIRFPMGGYDPQSGLWVCLVNYIHGTDKGFVFFTNLTAVASVWGFFAVSRPTHINNAIHWWSEDQATLSGLNTRVTYFLSTLAPIVTGGGTISVDAVAAIDSGIKHAATAIAETRRNVAVNSAVTTSTVESTALPIYGSQSYHSVDAITVTSGAYTDVGRPITANGQTIIPGALIREWDGSAIVESGLSSGPRVLYASAGGTGAVPVGDFIYAVVWEWRDAIGRRHQSPPKLLANAVTVSGSPSAVTVTFDSPTFSSKNLISAAIYRTVAGGTHLYFVDVVKLGVNSPLFTYTDVADDATISSNQVLYTEGGQLPHDPPPPAKYACAGPSRVLLGGLENPCQVQWSKLIFTGEPVQWSSFDAYKVTVDSPVTGVATLDGAWLIFTRDAIWEVVGEGPDDTGAGTFGEARKRPSSTGCISHRSLVETQDGVLFQGTNGGIWLLPRGGNAPTWIGQPIRDTLATYPTITAASHVPVENCIYWSCTNATNGILIVYDTRIGAWYVDTFQNRRIKTLATHGGGLVIDGFITQVASAAIDVSNGGGVSTAIAPEVITGDVRPFGADGWGRVRLINALGSSYSTGSLTMSISYDSGATWPDVGTWTSLGLLEELQLGPSLVRGVSYRIKLNPDPTFALTSLSFELYPSAGLRRLPGSKQR